MSRWLFREPLAVLHVGAHLAEEAEFYSAAGWGPVIWVEAQTELVALLSERFSETQDLVFQGCVWSKTGVHLDLNLSTNSQSSSVFRLGSHSVYYPDIEYVAIEKVVTVRLDELVPSGTHFDFVNLDIQGAELEALKGLGNRIHSVRAIYVEVNDEELYEGIPLVSDIDQFLESAGFLRVFTFWTQAHWGDALYVRPGRFLSHSFGRMLLRAALHIGIHRDNHKRQRTKFCLRVLRKIAGYKNELVRRVQRH